MVCECATFVRSHRGDINVLRREAYTVLKRAGQTLWQLDYDHQYRSFVVMTSTTSAQFISDTDWEPDPWV